MLTKDVAFTFLVLYAKATLIRVASWENDAADQRLRFVYTDNTIPLLSTYENFMLQTIFYASTALFEYDLVKSSEYSLLFETRLMHVMPSVESYIVIPIMVLSWK